MISIEQKSKSIIFFNENNPKQSYEVFAPGVVKNYPTGKVIPESEYYPIVTTWLTVGLVPAAQKDITYKSFCLLRFSFDRSGGMQITDPIIDVTITKEPDLPQKGQEGKPTNFIHGGGDIVSFYELTKYWQPKTHEKIV